jgi:hypothetical protein
MYGGVSLDTFVKYITLQRLSPLGLQNVGPCVEIMAEVRPNRRTAKRELRETPKIPKPHACMLLGVPAYDRLHTLVPGEQQIMRRDLREGPSSTVC